MDTIHHLLRLNVEIEGALRVLANRDNEIAMRILDEKTHEFSDIVNYLTHPEEIPSSDKETLVKVEPNVTDNIIEDNHAHGNRQSISDSSDSSMTTISLTMADDDETSLNQLFDDTAVESEVLGRVLTLEEKNDLQASGPILPEPIAPKPEVKHTPIDSSLPNQSDTIESKSTGTSKTSTPTKIMTEVHTNLKDKIRIDEMLSRKEARNLSKAFTINDRFRFQLHIFDGDKEAFNNTIEVLSSLKDYDSAITYLSGILEINTDDQDMADFLTIIQNHFVV